MIKRSRQNLETVILTKNLPISLYLTLTGLAFLIPTIFSYPQWLIGTMINTLLFIAALKLDFKKQLPIIILPSLGALAHGVLFGPLTVFLLYFLPFIWLGNAVLVGFVGLKLINHWPFLYRALIASILKFTVLFLIAYVYTSFGLVPAVFLSAMGLIQLMTAMTGAIAAFFVIEKIKFND
jgi:hypothetical protein